MQTLLRGHYHSDPWHIGGLPLLDPFHCDQSIRICTKRIEGGEKIGNESRVAHVSASQSSLGLALPVKHVIYFLLSQLT